MDAPSPAAPAASPVVGSSRPLRELLVLAIPLTAGNLSVAAMQFADGVMVSHLGTSAVAALLPVNLVFWMVAMIPLGVGGAAGIFAAQCVGRQAPADAIRYAWQGVWLGLSTVVFAALAVAFADPLMLVVTPGLPGAPPSAALFDRSLLDPQVNALMHEYWQWRAWGLPLSAATVAMTTYLAAIGRPWLPVVTGVAANMFNVLANWVLIFGNLGAPRMGMAGSALATLLATALQAALLAAVLVRLTRAAADPANPRPAWWPDATRLRQLVAIGVPSGCHGFFDLIGWNVMMIVLVKVFGTAQLAATNIVTEYMRLAFMPTFGIAQALGVVVGTLIGAGQVGLAAHRARLAFALGGGYMGLCGLAMILFRDPLADVFNYAQDPAVAAACRWMFVLAGLFQVFDAANIVFANALRGAGDTRFLMRGVAGVNVLCLAAASYLTFFQPQLGSVGPWLAATIYVILLGLLFGWRFASRRWQTVDIFAVR